MYVEEDGSRLVRDSLAVAALIATSAISYVEARAALARRRSSGDISVAEHRRAVAEFERDWERCICLEVTEPLIRSAAALAEVHRLRAYDAVHLASAKVLRDGLGESVTIACWDAELACAAAREGFESLRDKQE